MDKNNEAPESANATNPLYQGTARPAAKGDDAGDSINEAEDAVRMSTARDNDEESTEETG